MMMSTQEERASRAGRMAEEHLELLDQFGRETLRECLDGGKKEAPLITVAMKALAEARALCGLPATTGGEPVKVYVGVDVDDE
jgi:hypothetical protein